LLSVAHSNGIGLHRVTEVLRLTGLRESVMPGAPDDVIAATVTCWAGLFGLLSFEVFGQFENVISDRAAFFAHAVGGLGRLAGLPG
jgi:hypothetical protein